jgi:putative membrane-bound dehydrogenase-like protein
MLRRASIVAFACLVCLLVADNCWAVKPGDSPERASEFPGPKSPEESLASITVPPNLSVELVAAEPLVADPIDVAFGPDGRVWVVEMGDYPSGIDGKPGGRVRFLTDEDGDGKLDKSTLFLDGLNSPTSVAPWRSGVLVTAAPDILYAEDTDGDGRADRRQVLYTGFEEGNQQHRVNGLQWGLDNWLYVANGDSGGVVTSKKTGEKVDISGRDLRIQPDTGAIDVQTGRTQYGRNRDDWGNWFGCNNSRPAFHFVLDDFYLRRNPHLAAPPAMIEISETPGPARVYPTSKTLARFNDRDRANRFTSACGHIIYRDDRLGAKYAGNSFVCEPVHNLVHREVVEPNGVTFRSRRPQQEQTSEFFASTDNWCRPTSVRLAPDGSLWVVDMYRLVIEHPKWIPEEWQAKLNLRDGDKQGRIYRIFSKKTDGSFPRLDRMTTVQLVAALDSPSGWQRDMASQLLIWRGDAAAVEPLENLLAKCPRPQARLHALCTLDAVSALKDEVLIDALADAHPGVRRHAVRISETRKEPSAALTEAVLARLDDEDPQVQMQLAYSLGQLRDPRSAEALAVFLLHHQQQEYLLAAALSSVDKSNLAPIVRNVLRSHQQGKLGAAALLQVVRLALAMGDEQVIEEAIDVITAPRGAQIAAWQMQVLAGLRQSLARLQQRLNADSLARLERAFAQARTTANSEDAAEEDRLAAIALLGGESAHRDEDVRLLGELLGPQNSPAIQQAAVDSLAQQTGSQAAKVLLDQFPAASPRLRSQMVEVLLSRQAWTRQLLAEVGTGRLPANQLSPLHRQSLLSHRDDALRRKAEQVLADTLSADRKAVVESYRPALALTGDVSRGRTLFRKNCANCHRLEDHGFQVGPDLASLKNKSAEAMLIAVLDPNQAVEDKFLQYSAVTDAGQVLTGMLAEETSTTITLLGPEGKKQTILRGELDELIGSGKSLMPDGMEKELSKQDFADLTAYVAGNQQVAPSDP